MVDIDPNNVGIILTIEEDKIEVVLDIKAYITRIDLVSDKVKAGKDKDLTQDIDFISLERDILDEDIEVFKPNIIGT